MNRRTGELIAFFVALVAAAYLSGPLFRLFGMLVTGLARIAFLVLLVVAVVYLINHWGRKGPGNRSQSFYSDRR